MVPHDRHAVIWFVPNLDFGPMRTPASNPDKPPRIWQTATTTPTPIPAPPKEGEKEDIWALRVENDICPGGYTASLLESHYLAEIFEARANDDIIVSDQSQEAAEVGDLAQPSVLTFLLGLDTQAVEYVIKALAVLDKRILLFRNAESIHDAINILNTAGLEFGSFIADAIRYRSHQSRKPKEIIQPWEVIQPRPHEFVEPNTK